MRSLALDALCLAALAAGAQAFSAAHFGPAATLPARTGMPAQRSGSLRAHRGPARARLPAHLPAAAGGGAARSPAAGQLPTAEDAGVAVRGRVPQGPARVAQTVLTWALFIVPLVAAACPSLASAAGAAAAPVWPAKNQASAAVGFFFNVRTPAALIAAASLGNAFALTKATQKPGFDTPKWKRLCSLYGLLMVTAFGLEVMTVFMGTAAGVRMLGGNFDAVATSPIAMLVREFQYDYVAVRTQFVTGLLCFITAQAIRVYHAAADRPFLARSLMTFLFFAAAQCVAFFNSHLVFFGGYPQLLWSYISLTVSSFFSGGLLPAVAGVLLVASVVFALLSLIDTDGDGNLSAEEFKVMLSSLSDTVSKLRGGMSGK